jgi:hypothetical protein
VYLNEDTKHDQHLMKTACSTIISLTALTLSSAHAQPSPPPAPTPPASAQAEFGTRLQKIIAQASGTPAPEPSLTKFDLDFPGGTPKELVAAIQKAMGRPLNAIIPEDLSGTKLPALKMSTDSECWAAVWPRFGLGRRPVNRSPA